MFFLIKIAKKGILLTCRVMWRAGPGGEPTWRAGPARGREVALRPRGRATADPREAQVALTRGMTRRNREVIDFKRYRVKNNTELTNLMKMYRIQGYNGKYGSNPQGI